VNSVTQCKLLWSISFLSISSIFSRYFVICKGSRPIDLIGHCRVIWHNLLLEKLNLVDHLSIAAHLIAVEHAPTCSILAIKYLLHASHRLSVAAYPTERWCHRWWSWALVRTCPVRIRSFWSCRVCATSKSLVGSLVCTEVSQLDESKEPISFDL